MFGTMMAGGVYAPINLDHPPERRRHVLSRFEPDAMIAMTESELPDHDRSNDCLDIPIETLGLDALWQPAPAGDLAYVMFTSGSTGEPKGVMISRSALAHYVDWAHREMAVTSEDRWSQHPNIAFDLSVLDIFGALCAGASLYPLTQRKERLFPASAIREHRLSIWNSVPSVVDLMRRTGQLDADHLGSLRLITFCGEPLGRSGPQHSCIRCGAADVPWSNHCGAISSTGQICPCSRADKSVPSPSRCPRSTESRGVKARDEWSIFCAQAITGRSIRQVIPQVLRCPMVKRSCFTARSSNHI